MPYPRGLGTPEELEPCLKVAGRVSAESAHLMREPGEERVGEISLSRVPTMQVSSDPGQGEGWGKEGKKKRGEIRASLLCFSGARLPHTFGRLESLEHNTVSYPYSQNLQDLRLPSALFLPGVPRVPLNRLSG